MLQIRILSQYQVTVLDVLPNNSDPNNIYLDAIKGQKTHNMVLDIDRALLKVANANIVTLVVLSMVKYLHPLFN